MKGSLETSSHILEGVEQLLADPQEDSSVRYWLTHSLKALGGKSRLPDLALEDSKVGRAAISSLARKASDEDIEMLWGILNDPRTPVENQLECLKELVGLEIFPHRRSSRRTAAIDSRRPLPPELHEPSNGSLFRWFTNWFHGPNTAAAPSTETQIERKDEEVNQITSRELLRRAALDRLSLGNGWEQHNTAEILVSLHESGCEELLESLLNRESWRERLAGAYILARLGKEQGLEVLVSALRDPLAEARTRAAHLLAFYGGEDRGSSTTLLPALTAAIAAEEDPSVLYFLAYALGELGDFRAVPALLARLSQPVASMTESEQEARSEIARAVHNCNR